MTDVSSTVSAAADTADAASIGRKSAASPRSLLARYRTVVMSSAALCFALLGTWFILAPASSESTDDAYLAADVTTIAPKVRGLVSAILVADNQVVKAGDPLVKIDPEEFDARVASARADLADAEAGIVAARAAIESLRAEQQLDLAYVRATHTAIESSLTQADRAATDSRRYQALVRSGAVSQRDADSSRANAVTARQDAVHSSAMLGVARETLKVTEAKQGSLDASLQKANATLERAHSSLDLALQDRRHALIVAPIDGVVGKRQVQPGEYVVPGTRLLTLVPLHGLYVIANFKETQTGRMVAGQHARVQVDALSGHVLAGEVESLAPGSGSQFSLLPFEPGSGNFTKIVQRVPVRIRFENPQPYLDGLRPGLSVTAKVILSR